MKYRNLFAGAGLAALVGGIWMVQCPESSLPLSSSLPTPVSTSESPVLSDHFPHNRSDVSPKGANSAFPDLEFSNGKEDTYLQVQEILSNLSPSDLLNITYRFSKRVRTSTGGLCRFDNLYCYQAELPSAESLFLGDRVEGISSKIESAFLIGVLYKFANLLIKLHEPDARLYIAWARSIASEKGINTFHFERPLIDTAYLEAEYFFKPNNIDILYPEKDYALLGQEIAIWNNIDVRPWEKNLMETVYQFAEPFAEAAQNSCGVPGSAYLTEFAVELIDYGLNIAERNGWEDSRADFLALEELISQCK